MDCCNSNGKLAFQRKKQRYNIYYIYSRRYMSGAMQTEIVYAERSTAESSTADRSTIQDEVAENMYTDNLAKHSS